MISLKVFLVLCFLGIERRLFYTAFSVIVKKEEAIGGPP